MNTTFAWKIKWMLSSDKGKQIMLDKKIEALKLPKDVITLQKAVPPYIPIQHGYVGVLLYNTKTDKIQCHICGDWRNSLGQHLKGHKITAREYKDKFGLYRNQPLYSLGTSRRVSEIAKTRGKATKKNLTQAGRMKGIKTANFIKNKGAKKVQFQNQFGTCEAQLRTRVRKHVEQNGFFPRSTSKTDPNLATMLWRRFGSIAEAKKHYGYK